jgi:hypothetical protein
MTKGPAFQMCDNLKLGRLYLNSPLSQTLRPCIISCNLFKILGRAEPVAVVGVQINILCYGRKLI